MGSAKEICGYCGSDDLILDEETGELICAGCGLVVSTGNLTRTRYVEEPDTPYRSTSVGPEMERLMTIDRRIRLDEEDTQGLRQASTEIKRLVESMYLPDSIVEAAEGVYRRAQKDGLVLRGTIIGFSAASVYAACRIRGIPRTLRDVSEASTEEVKDIARMYRILVSELNLSVEIDSPIKHVERIGVDVGVSYRVVSLATALLREAIVVGYQVGKSPKGLAAAALYISCTELNERCKQEALADASGVSSLTIRKRVNGLKKSVDIEKIVNSFDV